MNKSGETSVQGIGLGGALFVLFLGLKLAHVIEWSWWWVTAPLWAPLALFVFIALIVILFSLK